MLLEAFFILNLLWLGAEGCLSLVLFFFVMEKQTPGFPVETGIAGWDFGLGGTLNSSSEFPSAWNFFFLPLESCKEIK